MNKISNTKEKTCAFYASDYHFEMISLPYIDCLLYTSQIIPTTVIAIRNSLGSENPTSIVFPVWIATIAAAVF